MEFGIKIFIALIIKLLENFYTSFQGANNRDLSEIKNPLA